jgi:pimeloyl-ACP methyl ester carboxylesterase
MVLGTVATRGRAARGQRALSIPGATKRLVEGAGHLIQYDAPDELFGVLEEWLADQPR